MMPEKKDRKRIAGPFAHITPEWAWGGADGGRVKVAVIDTGIAAGHPDLKGAVARSVAVELDDRGRVVVRDVGHGDLSGHGTACAGIIHAIAPNADLYSVRVLGRMMSGFGAAFLAGLGWAVAEGMDVVNLSLGTTNRDYVETLHELADAAFFRRSIIVSAASNRPEPSYPSVFSNLLGVRSARLKAPPSGYPFPYSYAYGAPVEVGAPGDSIRVPWPGGGHKEVTGNSFACPHVSGLVALMLSKHRGLTPFQVQTILHTLSLPR